MSTQPARNNATNSTNSTNSKNGTNGNKRRLLTKTEWRRLNKQRRLPKDLPTVKRLDSGLSESQRKTFLNRTKSKNYSQTQQVFESLHRSDEAHKLVKQLRNHPGPPSTLHPMVLLAAVVCQATKDRPYWRSGICIRINGFDSRLWFEHGMCDKQTRTPVSYQVVCQQMTRIEQLFDGGDDNVSDVFNRFSSDLLKHSIPQARIDALTAVSIDQTAFPSFYRTTDFRPQKEIDDIIKATGKPPADAKLGPDGKLIRCKDPDARAGHRSASTAAGGKAGEYVGFATNLAVAVRPTKWSGRLDEDPLIPGTEVPPYIVGMSADPASANAGEVCRQATMNAKTIAPRIDDVIADRGITACLETFNRPLHEAGMNVTMDFKKQPNSNVNVAAKLNLVEVGQRPKQTVYASVDGFYPLWLPTKFLNFPANADKETTLKWYEDRYMYRMVENGSSPDGSKQYLCPVHGGRVTPKKKPEGFSRTPKQSSVTIDLGTKKCCEGSFKVPVNQLDTYQKIPYGTRAHKLSYGRRNQVENSYGCLRSRGGLSPEYCRAIGLGAHRVAALALCIANNLYFAAKDAQNPKPTPFIGCDCLKTISGNGQTPKPAAGVCTSQQRRAPP